jgi:glutathione S-transferase/alpha,alpha-trehalase
MMIWSLGDIILKDDGRTFQRRFRRERPREAPLCLPLPPPKTRIRIRIITTVAAAAARILLAPNNNENNNTTNNNNEFILYGSQGSRSPLINWYLYEKEVQFELKEPRDVSNPHPFGQVPALRHKENVELFESGAILLYLADKCGELKSDEAKANAYSWVLWANASLDPICFKEDINGRVIDTGIKNETKGMRRLDDV